MKTATWTWTYSAISTNTPRLKPAPPTLTTHPRKGGGFAPALNPPHKSFYLIQPHTIDPLFAELDGHNSHAPPAVDDRSHNLWPKHSDADEIISGNLFDSPEWKTVLNAEPGTLIHLQWVILWKNYLYYWRQHKNYYGNYNRNIWVDDGVAEIPSSGDPNMHIPYTPQAAKKHIYLNDIVCLHFVACNWERMESKHRYYRAHEKFNINKLSNLAILVLICTH